MTKSYGRDVKFKKGGGNGVEEETGVPKKKTSGREKQFKIK